MTNRRYVAGRNYEYRVANKLRKEGWTVLRTAGSHGEFDLVAIRYPTELSPEEHQEHLSTHSVFGGMRWHEEPRHDGQIKLIQCKAGKSARRAIKAVEQSDIKRWEGLYQVQVEVV